MKPTRHAMPVGFVGHGSPMLALDGPQGATLRAWASSLPRPRAVLVVSAHWTTERLAVTPGGSLIHDFAGFPEALRRVRYPAPRADELAREVADLLDGTQVVERGLDHGAWVPLVHMFPAADVPVAQLSLSLEATPADLLGLGARLAPLRERGVLLLGSGSVVHNLSRVDWADTSPPPAWATDFDRWVATVVEERDWPSLADWRRAPGAALSHPTDEHLRPLLVAAGAARPGDGVRFPVTGFELGSLSRRCVEIG